MTDNSPFDEQEPLARAIHRLREANTLHDSENYEPMRQDAAVDLVDSALDDIDDFIDLEMERVEEELEPTQ